MSKTRIASMANVIESDAELSLNKEFQQFIANYRSAYEYFNHSMFQ